MEQTTQNEFPIITMKIVKGRADYKCNKCGVVINKGEFYQSMYYQGEDMRVFPRKYCYNCKTISKEDGQIVLRGKEAE